MTACEKQKAIAKRINGLGDCFEQYSYLILISGQYPPMPEEIRTDENLVKGCQSLVWLKAENRGGVLRMWADSDTLIIKGILSMIAEIADGSPCGEIAELEFDVLDKTDLGLVFESERLTGISNIWRVIRAAAMQSAK